MESETKQCQNCKKDFVIESDDFDFYEKMKVPAPTWCPDCRMMRRMLWRNEFVWYRRKCDATGKSILSSFALDGPYRVYEQSYWRSDAWDPMDYGREYDFEKPFFEQFKGLFVETPQPNLVQKNVINSEYSNYGINLKNCYFVGGSETSEDSGYTFSPNLRSRECFDLQSATDNERVYDSISIEKSQGLRFSQDCVGCSDSYLLYDCRNCMNCFGCVGLRNKQFYIFNQSHSRESYFAELNKIEPWTYSGLNRAREDFNKLKISFPRKFASIVRSEHVTGDEIINARDCIYCFDTRNDVQNCKYSFRALNGSKDGYDAMVVWNAAELFYEVMSCFGQRIVCSALIWGGFDVQYSYNCFDCNNIFGCVGLHNKSYCVLNKQYTKEEYEELLAKIIQHMDYMPYLGKGGKIYKYGEFFPVEFAPFAYNETIAQDYFPIKKEDAIFMGTRWIDSDSKQYGITMKSNEIPDSIHDIPDSIIDEVIECAHGNNCGDHCSTAFRIVPQELQFLRKMNVPLPRLCPLCRRGERTHLKNPLHLWHRKCMKPGCTNEFETSYAPERAEIVYCETCYNNEVA